MANQMTWLPNPNPVVWQEVEERGWRHRWSVCMSEGRVRSSLTRKGGREGVQMAPQQTTHCVNLRNNFDFRDYRTASSPGRALLVSLTWSELGWGFFFAFWGLVKQIVIRRALLLVLVVAVIAAFLPANYRKICLPRLVIVVPAVFVVARALLDNCVQTTSSSSPSSLRLQTRRGGCCTRRFGPVVVCIVSQPVCDLRWDSGRGLLPYVCTRFAICIYTICMYSFATLRVTLHGIGLRGCD